MTPSRTSVAAVIRPVTPGDAAALLAFYETLSPSSRHLRFFTAWRPDADEARRLAEPRDGSNAIVALDPSKADSRIVGDARWMSPQDGVAEMAIAVSDGYQGMGLGRILFGRLAADAAERGIHTFTATILSTNERMRRLIEWWGFAVTGREGVDSVEVTLATAGGMPGWIPRRLARPRVLVEGRGWLGRSETVALEQAGYQVAHCLGPRPDGRGRACPLSSGERCRLADAADVIVFALPSDEPSCLEILAAHHDTHPDVPVVTGPSQELASALERLGLRGP